MRRFAKRAIVSITVIAAGLFFISCLQTRTFVFEKRIGIAATPAKIFSVTSNFSEYPKLFPQSHRRVTVVSGGKDGAGAAFDNEAVYKGNTFKCRWRVTEFERDKIIRMENDTAGTVIVMLHQVDYDTTEETVVASVNIPPAFKNEVFAVLEKDMSSLKAACERRSTPADSLQR